MTKKDLKVGMVCEVEEFGKSELVMITYNDYDELCFSGVSTYGELSKVDEETLTYGGGEHKFLKVYGRSTNARAHKLSTERRELLWERPKYYNGKVICINASTDNFTKGKIYEFKMGKTVNNKGNEAPIISRIASVEHLNSIMQSEFIEVVE